jgi:hypothetical protein
MTRESVNNRYYVYTKIDYECAKVLGFPICKITRKNHLRLRSKNTCWFITELLNLDIFRVFLKDSLRIPFGTRRAGEKLHLKHMTQMKPDFFFRKCYFDVHFWISYLLKLS